MVSGVSGALGSCPYCGAPVTRAPEGYLVCNNGHVIEEYEPVLGYKIVPGDERSVLKMHMGVYSDVYHMHVGGVYAGEIGKMTTKAAIKDERPLVARDHLFSILRELGIGDDVEVLHTAVKKLDEILEKHKALTPRQAAVAAAVYAVYTLGKPFTVEDVLKAAKYSKFSMSRLTRILALVGVKPVADYRVRVVQRIAQIVSKLRLGGEVEALATRIAMAYVNAGIRKPTPLALAAAAVYIAAKILSRHVTHAMLRDVTGLTDTTIRNAMNDIIRSVYVEVRL